MQLFISVVLLILLAYGGSLLRHRKRGASWLNHLFGTGFVFCIVGVLLGPAGSGVISTGMLEELTPFVIFSLGWVGFLVGMQADLALLRQVPRRYLGFTLAESGLTIGAVTTMSVWIFRPLDVSGGVWVLLSLLTGACAGVSSQAIPAMATGRIDKEETLFLRVVTGLDDFPTMILVLVLFAYAGPARAIHDFWSGAFWLLITVFLGLCFGLVFYILLRPRAKFDETLAICIGVTILSAGAAAYLHLAVPAIGFFAGFFVANAPLPKKQTFYNVLTIVERPIVFLLFLVAGTYLRMEEPWWLIPLAAYVAVRGVVKVWVGGILARWFRPNSNKARTIGWGLIAPGPLSVAIALDYYCVQRGPNAEILLWIVIAGAVIGELMVPIAMRRLSIQNDRPV
ncbi:MAG: cation:proton antiporter [bacterium]